MKRTTLVLIPALLAAVAFVPLAEAQPRCIQVYPWSELCQGDYEGFQEAVVDDDVCYVLDGQTRCFDATVCLLWASCNLL